MEIQRIEHVSINTLDFERSIDFYGRILGFTQRQTVDCGDFNITYFEIPGGERLELFDYHGRNPVVNHPESATGLRHLAFAVRDVNVHEQQLREAGVEITLPVTDLPDLGVRVLLALDPNGVTLEFCEAL
ncbi:MAG: VOC family protein [Anaerolineaceae bacterium]|nr:VOC family protein [Anaerolineaceae bacterium]